jgi:hypothetical protein
MFLPPGARACRYSALPLISHTASLDTDTFWPTPVYLAGEQRGKPRRQPTRVSTHCREQETLVGVSAEDTGTLERNG